MELDAGPVASRAARRVLLPLLAVVGWVAVLPALPSISPERQEALVPVVLAVICCLDLFSLVLLVGQFLVTGERRVLAVGCAYLFSLVLLVTRAAVFGLGPGEAGDPPQAVLWLWLAWHGGFVVLLAAALLPWPAAAGSAVPVARRTRRTGRVLGATLVGAGGLGAGLVTLAHRMPALVDGVDTGELVRRDGPVARPGTGLVARVAVVAAGRWSGPLRWAGLAAAASFGDVALTLSSSVRNGGGWYAGRALSVLAAGVMVAALLAEFSSIRRRLAVEGERLRDALERAQELERVQQTLLRHMAGGVLMWDRDGQVRASNPAARELLGVTEEQLRGSMVHDLVGCAFRPDGSPWGPARLPSETTFATGEPTRAEVLLQPPDGPVRWLTVTSEPVRTAAGSVDHVVSSLTDGTARHAEAVARAAERRTRRAVIADVVRGGGPDIVLQPIVELAGRRVVGFEALARFPGLPHRGPEAWFAEAAEVGLGVELELSAIRAALRYLDDLPAGTHLSVNAGPATAACPELLELLDDVPPRRVVLELTEHVGVDDYSALTEALAGLRRRGLRLAVDDAGSGFASLRHVLNLAPDVIKLDGELVGGLDRDPARRALAGALLAFGADIGAEVVAEGIETARECAVLRGLGFRLGQGHHLGRPEPLVTLPGRGREPSVAVG